MSVHVEVPPSALSLAAEKLRRSVADDPTALAARPAEGCSVGNLYAAAARGSEDGWWSYSAKGGP